MNSIEAMLAMFLCFAVGLLLGFTEGSDRGWRDCGQFYREFIRQEIMPLLRKGKRP